MEIKTKMSLQLYKPQCTHLFCLPPSLPPFPLIFQDLLSVEKLFCTLWNNDFFFSKQNTKTLRNLLMNDTWNSILHAVKDSKLSLKIYVDQDGSVMDKMFRMSFFIITWLIPLSK